MSSVAETESCREVMNADLYNAKRTPVDHVKSFISEKLPQFGWGQTRDKEVVLDVGCGPGNNTVQLVLPLFPQAEKILGIDFLPNMIQFARNHNHHPLIEYSVANIENWSMVERWRGQISKLISIHCVHWLKDKRQGFQNMFKLLKPGGEAALCFVMSSPIFVVTMELENNPKWNKFFKNVDNFIPDTHIKKHESTRYIQMLEDVGFDILHYEEEEKSDPFSSDEEYRDFFSSLCPFVPYVPSHQREEFKDAIFNGMLKLNGRDSSGRPLHTANIIEVVARKGHKTLNDCQIL